MDDGFNYEVPQFSSYVKSSTSSSISAAPSVLDGEYWSNAWNALVDDPVGELVNTASFMANMAVGAVETGVVVTNNLVVELGAGVSYWGALMASGGDLNHASGFKDYFSERYGASFETVGGRQIGQLLSPMGEVIETSRVSFGDFTYNLAGAEVAAVAYAWPEALEVVTAGLFGISRLNKAVDVPNTNTSLMSSNSGFIGTVDDSFVGLSHSDKLGLAFNRIEDVFGAGYSNRTSELFNSVRQGSFSSSTDLGLFKASGKKPIIELNENIGNVDVMALTVLHETRHLRQFNKLQESIMPSNSILTKTDQIRAYNQTKSRWGSDLSVVEKETFATSTNIWQGKKLGLNADDLNIFQDYYDFYRK